MRKDKTPRHLAEEMAERSTCAVRVGAVLVDPKGRIFSWGWNNMGHDGRGQHAEDHAVSRSNAKRLRGSTIYVYGVRNRNDTIVCSKPCDVCRAMLFWVGVRFAYYRDKDGDWNKMELSA